MAFVFIYLFWFISAVHIPRGNRSIWRSILPVCHVWGLHVRMARTSVLMPFYFADVYHSTRYHDDCIYAHLLYNIQKVTRSAEGR